MGSNEKLAERLNGEEQTANTPAFLGKLQKSVEEKNHPTIAGIDVSPKKLELEKKTDFNTFAAFDNVSKSNNLNDFETPNNIA